MSLAKIFTSVILMAVFGISLGNIFMAVNFFEFGLILWVIGAISGLIAIGLGIKFMYDLMVSGQNKTDKEVEQ